MLLSRMQPRLFVIFGVIPLGGIQEKSEEKLKCVLDFIPYRNQWDYCVFHSDVALHLSLPIFIVENASVVEGRPH